MTIRKSNLLKHREYVVNLRKKGTWGGITRAEIADESNSVLWEPIPYVGLNPYKAVEMFHKYRPVVPDEFQTPSAEVYSKVTKEKVDRTEFHKKIKLISMRLARSALRASRLPGPPNYYDVLFYAYRPKMCFFMLTRRDTDDMLFYAYQPEMCSFMLTSLTLR
jgi:hypothetical protein